jgi:hypothetical protein
MIDQMLYPDSELLSPLAVSGANESVKKFNESVDDSVIDAGADDSAAKLIVVICIY